MCLPHNLFREDLLSRFRVPRQIINFLLAHIWLCYQNLTLYLWLNCIFEFCLNCLWLAQNISKFLRKSPMHSLFYSRFGFIFEFFVRLCNLEFHCIQVSLDLFEQISILLNDSIYLICFDFLVRRLVLVNLLVRNLFHIGVILVTHY